MDKYILHKCRNLAVLNHQIENQERIVINGNQIWFQKLNSINNHGRIKDIQGNNKLKTTFIVMKTSNFHLQKNQIKLLMEFLLKLHSFGKRKNL